MDSLKRSKIDEKVVKNLHQMGYSDRKIAIEISASGIKVSQSGVMRCRQRLGLEPNHHSSRASKNDKRDPKQKYDDAMYNARIWKSHNQEKVKKGFAEWQENNREARNAYMQNWRKNELGKESNSIFRGMSTRFIEIWRKLKWKK